MQTSYRKKPSGVVINTNKDGYFKARKLRQAAQQEKERFNNLEEKVHKQGLMLERILQLLEKEYK